MLNTGTDDILPCEDLWFSKIAIIIKLILNATNHSHSETIGYTC